MQIELQVSIEIQGKQHLVGFITGNTSEDATFIYADSYLELPHIRPISLNLPLQKESFTPEQTRIFFEGLLPEGFSRKSVANWLKADEDDYVRILENLGRECLGAVQVYKEEDKRDDVFYEPLSREQVCALAAEGATQSTKLLMETHLSLAGASGKVGLYFHQDSKRWYLPKGRAASTHIVKQSHVRLHQMVLNEQLCMLTAKKIGIEVPQSFIIDLGKGEDDKVLYATKRYDRVLDSDRQVDDLSYPLRLHQEDFSQALGIPSNQKYERSVSSYMKKMFQILNDFSSNPIEDKMKLWDMIVFHYLIGNTDGHVKNFSLLYSADMKSIRLAPAYDIVSTSVYGLTDEMSFYIGGELKRSNMDRETFQEAAREVQLGEKIAMQRYDYIADNIQYCLEEAAKELYDSGFQDVFEVKNQISSLIRERLQP